MPTSRLDPSPGRLAGHLRRRWQEWERDCRSLVARGLGAMAQKLPVAPPVAGSGPVGASMADVAACYRLLLQRPPDAGGLEHYRGRVDEGIGVPELVEEFLGSVEFARAHGRHGKPQQAPSELVVTREGFRIHVDPSDFAVGHTIARTAGYEEDVSAEVRRLLGRGQTFVDVGANIGWFSLLAAALVGPEGRVVAVEPNPANVTLLRQSAKENGFDNIDVIGVALAEKAGAVALETDGSNGRIIPIDGPPAQPVGASFVVASYPLDTILAQAGVGRVDLMKIDVEGAEPLVLRGGAATLARDRPVLITEFYPLALECSPWGSPEGYLASLRQLGYELSVIGTDGPGDDASIMALAGSGGNDHVDLLARPL